MLCRKNDAVESFTKLKTETQETLDHICKRYHNSKLRFLILLHDRDFHKWCISLKDMLWNSRNNFPGELSIEKYEESDQLPFTIEEPVMPRQLYIMLPKERIYVPSDQFTGKYIRSKMQELIRIFVTLQATSIKYVRYDSHQDNTHFGVGINSGITQVKISESAQYENRNTNNTGIEYELKLNPSKEPLNVNLFSDCSFYYLKRNPAWKDLILRRIDNGVIFDKYTYWNKERQLLKSGFEKQMQWFNVSANYDWEKYADLMIDYEVTYEDEDGNNDKLTDSSDDEVSLKKERLLAKYI